MTNYPNVTPKFERETKAVKGPFYVRKGACIICDLPPQTTPRCIKMKEAKCNTEKYCHVYKQPETVEELDLMIEAAENSCVSAIRYCGTDPAILARLSPDLCDAEQT